jgi:hypothetical protein
MSNIKQKLMAGISYPENISYLGNKPNFTRDAFDTFAEMQDALLAGYIDEGHLSYCKANGKHYKATKTELGGLEWKVFDPDGASDKASLKILTQEGYDSIENPDDRPTDYIHVDDIETEIEAKNALPVLFSAIRALQAEVTKLKNSFQLGINSATGNETTSSRIISELSDVEEEEPLWAVQESELSSLFSLQFNTETELAPKSHISLGPENKYIKITGEAYWEPDPEKINIPNLPDAKLFLYLTTSKKTVILHFTGGTDELEYEVSLENLLSGSISSSTYAILVAVSKKIEDKITGSLYGESFIWIAVQDLVADNVLFEKYINPDGSGVSSGTIKLSQNYYLSRVSLSGLELSKFDLYSKYQDFSDHVDAVRPSDIDGIKYKAAHLTIRSIETVEELDAIIRKLQENELVYVTSTNSLYIIYGNSKHRIGGSGGNIPEPDIDTMTVQDLIKNLADRGLITLTGAVYDDNGELTSVSDVDLAKISSMSFINESTGAEITYTVDSDGQLQGYTETPENLKFSYIVEGDHRTETVIGNVSGELNSVKLEGLTANRGFISRVHGDTVASATSDQKLKADRVKIGAFYAPLSTATVWGCTNAYVELENTSDTTYYLDGCYLHFAGPIIGKATDGSGTKVVSQATYHLPLKGKLPAGGTYLVRGFKYTDSSLPTTYIDVKTFDTEWYVTRNSVTIVEQTGYDYSDNYGKLIKFDYEASGVDIVYGFALTYGQPSLSYNKLLIEWNREDKTTPCIEPFVIDSLNMFISQTALAYWNILNEKGKLNSVSSCPGNAIIKNTFELDPAKQAFQSYSTNDSSRLRGATAADNQIIELNQEYIQFPNSNDVSPVSKFTPKASFEHKNVSTDKTDLDPDRPNMPTVSFGINQATTRCFNWISVGYYDEFVWIRENSETPWTRIQSYWGDKVDTSSIYSRKNFDIPIVWEGGSTTVREVVYAAPKYKNIFPGCNVSYTSHKCVVDINYTIGDTPKTFEYIVGRSNSDGTPQKEHVSDIQTFTLYPNSWKPVIYQITDQQGFHWIEYQAWAAAAKKVNQKIQEDQASENIIPILLNTGDMTQNGTRINEWLDYYKAGQCLFDHLEQMNVVGNNDLGNSNEKVLGTGDDPGKSNPHFYNMCYCYDVPLVTEGSNTYAPIYCGTNGPVYIPSMYYFDAGTDFRIFMGNTEITGTAGTQVFGGRTSDSGDPVDIYTGLTWKDGSFNTSDVTTTYVNPATMTIDGKNGSFYLYEVLYKWFALSSSKKSIFACHEMPFTVITQDNLGTGQAYADRSISVTGASTGLIGSHCNRNNYIKTGANINTEYKLRSKGTYWLSRLLENFGIKYCIGGHKHTYACTWPLREYYFYDDGGTIKNSLSNGKMTMPACLRDDKVYFFVTSGANPSAIIPTTSEGGGDIIGNNLTAVRNLTKFPIVASKNFIDNTIIGNYADESQNYITSVTKDTRTDQTYVVYFMLQATGFKLKSNKELPGTLQKFSQIIPKTSTGDSKPSKNQIYPMFAKIALVSSKYNSGLDFNLMAIKNIVPNDVTLVFNQQTTKVDPCNKEPEIWFFDNRSGDGPNDRIPYGMKSDKDAYGGACWGTEELTLDLHI